MPILDRLPEFDDRSKDFPVRALLATASPAPLARRSWSWSCPVTLDQGQEGACVGMTFAHEAAARPDPVPGVTESLALDLYHLAQELDEFPPGTEGTSVLAGAKAAIARGLLTEYRWALGPGPESAEADLAGAVSWIGPACLGVNWLDAHYEPRRHRDGLYWLEGFPSWGSPSPVAGGHAILTNRYSVRLDAYAVHNSWGLSWGRAGEAWVRRVDMVQWLADAGEACIPLVRRPRVRRLTPRHHRGRWAPLD